MKKILSMILALAIVFSLLSVSVVSATNTGEVTVYIQNFEGPESGWTKYFSSNFTGVKEDTKIPGNHHAYLTLTPQSVAYAGATALTGKNVSVAEGDFRLYQNAFTYRMTSIDIGLEHRGDRVYNFYWDGFFGSSDPSVERTKAEKHTSGMSHTKSWASYAKSTDTTPKKQGQWTGDNPYWKDSKGNMQTVNTSLSDYNSETGWVTFGYTNFGYQIWNGTDVSTIGAAGYESDKISTFFFQWKAVNKLRDLLVANKAYAGGGFEQKNQDVVLDNGTTYSYSGGYITDPELVSKIVKDTETFEITAEDVAKYDDMAKIDMSGNLYLPKTADEIASLPDSERYYDKNGVKTEYLPLVRKWHLFEDCTALKSAKKLEDFAEVLEKSISEIGVDNIKFTVNAKLYNDIVTVSGEADAVVTAVTNPVTYESWIIKGTGNVMNVNDYFGTEYTVETEAENVKAVYNGEELEVTNNGKDFSFSVAPEKITKDGTLEITTWGVKVVTPTVSLAVNEKAVVEAADAGFISGSVELSDMPAEQGAIIVASYKGETMEKTVKAYEGILSDKDSVSFKLEGAKGSKVKAFVLNDKLQPVCTSAEASLKEPPIIIFKFDDGRPANLSQTQCVNNALEYLTSRGIKGSVGVLTSTMPDMVKNPNSYKEQTKIYNKWIADGHELWLHGYDHGSYEDENGTTIYEFYESYENQKKSIKDSCDLMMSYFGYEFKTFGASWNRNNDDTVTLINTEFPQFKTILYGVTDKVKFNVLNIPYSNNCTIESKTGVASFDKFLSGFKSKNTKEVLVLQGHPPYWNADHMEEFKKIVTYLEDLGCKFMTPTEYRETLE